MGKWLDAIEQFTMFTLTAIAGIAVFKLLAARVPAHAPGASAVHGVAALV